MSNFSTSKIFTAFTLTTALAIPLLLPASAMAQDRPSTGRVGDERPSQNRSNEKRPSDRRQDRGRNDDRQQSRTSKDHKDDRREGDSRQKEKNSWRNLGIAGGALGIYGLLSGNNTLTALGIGGGLYSASRYEADRKSQNRDEHNRYDLFNRESFDHDGHHYVRQTKTVKGVKSYYFQRTR